MRVTKGIIVAAGYGVRFLPVTKVVPKELLPIDNRPALDLVIDEFAASGITDLLIIISPYKRLIAQYYRPLPRLERFLRHANRLDSLRRLAPPPVRITFTIQRQMRGTGHALLQARRFAGSDPVVVAYPDDLHLGPPPLTKQLIDAFQRRAASVLAVTEITTGHERYGILDVDAEQQRVLDIVEKPPIGQAPSNYASIGRFLFHPRFFDYLAEGWKRFDRRKQIEYYHIYALQKLIARQELHYHPIEGERLDIGNPAGYLAALNRLADTLR